MLTSLTNSRVTNSRRRKRKIAPAQPIPIYILTAEATGSILTLTFDQPVTLNGLPGFTVGAAHVTAADLDSPTELILTFSGGTSLGPPLTIPFQDPAIRNSTGGYVTSNQMPIG